jgi:penicillin G amidase
LVQDWNGRAETGSAGYYLLRMWLERFKRVAFGPFVAACREGNPLFAPATFRWEDPLWRLVEERRAGFLDPKFGSWDDAIVKSTDDVIHDVKRRRLTLPEMTWGRYNTLVVEHPLSQALPAFARGWLGLPRVELPGDYDVPRVQAPSFGASERMVVAPGREEQGLFEMPGGESGNPLSPFYRSEQEAWVRGEPAPLLPGPATHRLVLKPQA